MSFKEEQTHLYCPFTGQFSQHPEPRLLRSSGIYKKWLHFLYIPGCLFYFFSIFPNIIKKVLKIKLKKQLELLTSCGKMYIKVNASS